MFVFLKMLLYFLGVYCFCLHRTQVTKLAIALVGPENVHVTDLDILEKDKFETSNIKYKRLVIINEATSYKGVKKLKALTGGDRLRFEQKYKQALASFYPNALVIITSNEPIKTGDHTSGLYRREIPLSMNQRIPEKDQRKLIDHDRDNNITGEFAPYIPGLLNWVLEMDSDQATHIIKDPLNYAPGLRKSKLENLIDTNSIAAWLNEKVTYIDGYETQIGCKSPLGESKENIWLYANYAEYCSLTGVNAISSARFSYLLLDLCNNQLGFTVRKGRDRKGAFIQGLKIRDHLDADLPPLIEGIYTQSNDEPVVTVTSRQSPVTNNGQLTVTHDQSKVSNVCETARGVNERTTLVRSDWSLVTEDVTGSVTGERCISDECDGCDDFSETSNQNQLSSVGLIEKVLVSEEQKSKLEKREKNPSQSSHSSPARVTEDHQPVTSHHGVINGDDEQKENQQTPNYEVGEMLEGLVPHPVTRTMKVKGKVVLKNGKYWLEDKQGINYPLSAMEEIKVLSWSEYNG